MKTKKRIKKLEKAVMDLQQVVASFLLSYDYVPKKDMWKASTGNPIFDQPTITSDDPIPTTTTGDSIKENV